jgi:hypothetical protein
MRAEFKLDVRQVLINLEKFKDTDKNVILNKLDLILEDAADLWFQRSQELNAKSADTGELLASGDKDYERFRKVVYYSAPHAKYIEFGTDAHMPPVEPLIKYASRKLKADNPEQVGWAIAMKIKKEGTEPQPFLRPAFDEGVEYFIRRVTSLNE